MLQLAITNSFAEETKGDSLLFYKVKKNDNLYSIAQNFLSQSEIYSLSDFISEIRKLNDIPKNNLIHPKQILKIPVMAKIDTTLLKKIQHKKLKGIYLNTYNLNSAKLKEIIENYDSLGCNALIVDFKNTNGNILYPTKNSLALEIGACQPVISHPEKLIYLLHKHNISLIARITIFRDTTLANTHPKWTPKIAKDSIAINTSEVTEKIEWVNPNCVEVQKYNLEIIKEVISLGVDEIQLDYVRFPTESHLLNADFGVPDSLRQQVITNFVKSVYQITQKAGIKLSADIFGVVAFQNEQDIMNTGQNVVSMTEYLDRIHPMVYPSHFYGKFFDEDSLENKPYYFVRQSCQKLINIIEKKEKIIPYLQAFSLTESQADTSYIISQMNAVKDCGLEFGYLFWNAKGNYKPTWQALSIIKNEAKLFESETIYKSEEDTLKNGE